MVERRDPGLACARNKYLVSDLTLTHTYLSSVQMAMPSHVASTAPQADALGCVDSASELGPLPAWERGDLLVCSQTGNLQLPL